jgi:putative serine protease PepD
MTDSTSILPAQPEEPSRSAGSEPLQPSAAFDHPASNPAGPPASAFDHPAAAGPTSAPAAPPWDQQTFYSAPHPAGPHAYGPATHAYAAGPYGPAPVPPARRGRSAVVAAVLAGVLAGGGAGAAVVATTDHHTTAGTTSISTTAAVAAKLDGTVAAAAAKITPSVVTITVNGRGESGIGSGVVVKSGGYILTNDHVVSVAANGGSITVESNDGRTASATVVGRDTSDDLAVIKTSLTGLRVATFTSSSALKVGQEVVAVGAPLGLSDTVTSGIVSSLARTVRSGDDDQAVFAAIQTDAAINPGNSGGPLVDLNGNVAGINAAIASTSSSGVTIPGQSTQSGSIGIGFAIPSDEASRVANELIAGGSATHADLGVTVQGTSSTTAVPTGATIVSVSSGSPAAAASLRAGDVVTAVGQTRVETGDDLIALIRSHAPGDKVSLRYIRNGRTDTTAVTLGRAS